MQTTVSSTVKRNKDTKGLQNEIRLTRMNLLLQNHIPAWCFSYYFTYSKRNKKQLSSDAGKGGSSSGKVMSFLKKSMNSMKTQRHPGCRMIMALQSIHN